MLNLYLIKNKDPRMYGAGTGTCAVVAAQSGLHAARIVPVDMWGQSDGWPKDSKYVEVSILGQAADSIVDGEVICYDFFEE